MILVTLTLLTYLLLWIVSLIKLLIDTSLAITGEMAVKGAGLPVTVHVNIATPPTAAVVFVGPGGGGGLREGV